MTLLETCSLETTQNSWFTVLEVTSPTQRYGHNWAPSSISGRVFPASSSSHEPRFPQTRASASASIGSSWDCLLTSYKGQSNNQNKLISKYLGNFVFHPMRWAFFMAPQAVNAIVRCCGLQQHMLLGMQDEDLTPCFFSWQGMRKHLMTPLGREATPCYLPRAPGSSPFSLGLTLQCVGLGLQTCHP